MNRQTIVIVDGYNAIRRTPKLNERFCKSAEQGREALIRYCVEWKSKRRDVSGFQIVFDGHSSVVNTQQDRPMRGVRVSYTKTGETADSRILSILKAGRKDCKYVVVSDDNELISKARVLDAETVSTSEFCGTLPAMREKRKSRISESDTKEPLSPKIQHEITESLKKDFGIK